MNTKDPGDADPRLLVAARNVYIPDPEAGSGVYSRPGFPLLNGGTVIHSNITPFKGQGVFTNFDVNGDPTNWMAFGGSLYRYDAATDTATDVTPVGVTIDANTTTRVYFASLGGVMAVSDGVNRPWIASNLSSTPITGTYIDFDSAGGAWVAFGPPVVFGGSGFFVLTSVTAVGARLDIAWTEPNNWALGYQQTGYDNRWTLEQTGTTPINGLAGTNIALYYWRQRSIGSISGAVGPDLASTATHDAISTNVGTAAPQTIVQFGDTIYFCDVIGRPWSFTLGSRPKPIWHQLRAIVDESETGYPGLTMDTATAGFDPTLNQVCMAIWSPNPASAASPTDMQVFDANSGAYVGKWSIGPGATGISIDCIGSFVDAQGRGQLVVLGSATSGGTTGYAWGMSALTSVPAMLTLEDDTTLLVTEATPGLYLTTEGSSGTWMDDNEVPLIEATTDRLGYSEDYVWLFDEATILTGSQAPITVTIQTPNTSGSLEGTPTPNDSDDSVYRSVCGLDLNGRGAMVTVSPTTADEAWSLQRVTLVGVPNPAGPDDQ